MHFGSPKEDPRKTRSTKDSFSTACLNSCLLSCFFRRRACWSPLSSPPNELGTYQQHKLLCVTIPAHPAWLDCLSKGGTAERSGTVSNAQQAAACWPTNTMENDGAPAPVGVLSLEEIGVDSDAHGAAAATAAGADVAAATATPQATRTRKRARGPGGGGSGDAEAMARQGTGTTVGDNEDDVRVVSMSPPPILGQDDDNDDDGNDIEYEDHDGNDDHDSTSNSLVDVADPGITPRRSNRSSSNTSHSHSTEGPQMAVGGASIRGPSSAFASVALPSFVPSNSAADAGAAEQGADDPDDPQAPSPGDGGSGCLRCLRNAVRVLLFPVFVAASIVGLVLFLLFFCFPLLVFFLLLICVYYCCTDEPIPPRVLFRALWEDNTDALAAANGGGGGGSAAQGASPYTLDEILARIVSRRLLAIVVVVVPVDPDVGGFSHDNDDDGQFGPDVRNNAAHDGPVFLTDHDGTVLLRFTAPLPPVANKEDPASMDEELAAVPPAGEDTDDDDDDIERGVGQSSNEHPFDEEHHDDSDKYGQQHPHAAGSDASSDLESASLAPETPPSKSAAAAIPATTTTTTTSHLACDICLCEFEKGDVLAWSRNRACSHHFHRDCVVDWLRRRTTCPSCRQEFVQPP
jgi:Ring finger domain